MVRFESGRTIDDDGFSTTFPMDFAIADMFGVGAIRDTYERAFNEWKGSYKYLTHLVIALNNAIFLWYEKNQAIAKVYDELWRKADTYACDNLKGAEADYYFATTD